MAKNTKQKPKSIVERIKSFSALISAVVVIITTCGTILAWFESKMTEKIDKRLYNIETVMDDVRQDTVRLQLLQLMESDPENKESILTVAHQYFIEMKGDWYMTEKFKKWGEEHDVDLSDFTFSHATTPLQ